MYADHVGRMVRTEIQPILAGLGFSLVDCTIARLKGATRVAVTVHRPTGVGVDECEQISRVIFPRLQTLEGFEDVSLEVSSPGISRTLKRPEEYTIFQGRGVRILAGDQSEWIGGVIDGTRAETLVLRTKEGLREFAFSSIRKGRLDHTWDPPHEERKEDKENKNAV